MSTIDLRAFNILASPAEVLEHLEALAAICAPGGNKQRLDVTARSMRDALHGPRVSAYARMSLTAESYGAAQATLFSALIDQKWGLRAIDAHEARVAAEAAAKAAEQAAAEALAAQQQPTTTKRAARASAEESPT